MASNTPLAPTTLIMAFATSQLFKAPACKVLSHSYLPFPILLLTTILQRLMKRWITRVDGTCC